MHESPPPLHAIARGPEETRAAAHALAQRLSAGAVVALVGELGAGKTCFVQGLAEALGVTEPVTSPTFTLIQEYRGRLPLAHVDLYRLNDPEELLQLGLDEYLEGPGITVLEWADRAPGLLPAHAWTVTLRHRADAGERDVTIQPGAIPC